MDGGKALLSGNTGFLGRVLASELGAMGYRVAGLTPVGGQGRIDVSKPFTLDSKCASRIVIHAAGKAHSVPKSEEAKQEFYDVNLEGTKHLCRALDQLNSLPQSFIFISTVAVYGADTGSNINENHPLNGSSPYAESKILAEQWLADWASERGVVLGILRLPLVVGANPPGNLGAMIRGIKSGRYLSIGSADARKSMVMAEDIASVIPTLAQKGGIYNLTDGNHPTFGQLEEAIATALHKRKPYKVPTWVAKGLAKTGDIVGQRFPINSDKLTKITSTLTFDDSRAREKLGWNPTSVLTKVNELI